MASADIKSERTRRLYSGEFRFVIRRDAQAIGFAELIDRLTAVNEQVNRG